MNHHVKALACTIITNRKKSLKTICLHTYHLVHYLTPSNRLTPKTTLPKPPPLYPRPPLQRHLSPTSFLPMSTRSLCCLRYYWPFYLTAPSFFLFWLILSLSLQWFTSYLSSRTSAVSIPLHLSPSSSLTCGVPQDYVLGPILFNLYTTPLSTLISSSTISHLLYADDTQLLSHLLPKTFLLSYQIYSQPFHLFHPGCHQIA